MRESGYYPPGAEYDPTAPYNQAEPEEQMYDVKASFTLTTVAAVSTENYDDVGMCDPKEYLEQHMTPLQLIEQCRRQSASSASATAGNRVMKNLNKTTNTNDYGKREKLA